MVGRTMKIHKAVRGYGLTTTDVCVPCNETSLPNTLIPQQNNLGTP